MIENSNVPDNDNVRKIIKIKNDLTEDFSNTVVCYVLNNIHENVDDEKEGDPEKLIRVKKHIEVDNPPGIEEVSNDYPVGTEKIRDGN